LKAALGIWLLPSNKAGRLQRCGWGLLGLLGLLGLAGRARGWRQRWEPAAWWGAAGKAPVLGIGNFTILITS